MQRTGICKLTGKSGIFVRCHILPRALTKPPINEPFAQIGLRKRPTRRRDSWYDPHLVVRAGEDILTSYDTWAIAELRRLKLVWRSWGPMVALSVKNSDPLPGTPWGIRSVEFSDPSRMRLFLLSILWRAAATELFEFDEVTLRPSDLRRLRNAVRDGVPPPTNFFPATLTQISTTGPVHNLGPIAQIKRPYRVGNFESDAEPIYRFYFDGLVVHFHLKSTGSTMHGLEPMMVGADVRTTISTVPFERSWQLENYIFVHEDAEHEFPGETARAAGILSQPRRRK